MTQHDITDEKFFSNLTKMKNFRSTQPMRKQRAFSHRNVSIMEIFQENTKEWKKLINGVEHS